MYIIMLKPPHLKTSSCSPDQSRSSRGSPPSESWSSRRRRRRRRLHLRRRPRWRRPCSGFYELRVGHVHDVLVPGIVPPLDVLDSRVVRPDYVVEVLVGPPEPHLLVLVVPEGHDDDDAGKAVEEDVRCLCGQVLPVGSSGRDILNSFHRSMSRTGPDLILLMAAPEGAGIFVPRDGEQHKGFLSFFFFLVLSLTFLLWTVVLLFCNMAVLSLLPSAETQSPPEDAQLIIGVSYAISLQWNQPVRVGTYPVQ